MYTYVSARDASGESGSFGLISHEIPEINGLRSSGNLAMGRNLAFVLTTVLASGTVLAMPMHGTPGQSGVLVPQVTDYAALPTLAVARIFAAFAPDRSPVPPEVVDRLVRTELVARDTFQ